MQRISQHCTAILDRVIFIGFGVQIVLGTLWMCSAFAGLRSPGEGILCVGQLLLFAVAAAFFLRTVSGAGNRQIAFGTLCLLTFPMVLQCHMRVCGESVVASVLLLEAALVLRSLRGHDKAYSPKRLFALRSVTALLTTGILLAAGRSCLEKITVSHCLASRFTWTSLEDAYSRMPEERKALLDGETVYYSMHETNGMEKILIPSLRDHMDEAEVNVVLRELAVLSLESRKTQIAKEIFWDALGYTAAPLILPRQLAGRNYDSLSGKRYLQILQPAPRLGKNFMAYGCFWFPVAMILSVILRFLKRNKRGTVGAVYEKMIVLSMCFFMVAIYTMSGAGIMDYTKTIFVLCVWLAWIWRAGEIR